MKNELDFVWDKKEQEFCDSQNEKTRRDGKQNVEEYLDFLSQIILSHEDPYRNDFIEKPFCL
jgi:hypothetical protein